MQDEDIDGIWDRLVAEQRAVQGPYVMGLIEAAAEAEADPRISYHELEAEAQRVVLGHKNQKDGH